MTHRGPFQPPTFCDLGFRDNYRPPKQTTQLNINLIASSSSFPPQSYKPPGRTAVPLCTVSSARGKFQYKLKIKSCCTTALLRAVTRCRSCGVRILRRARCKQPITNVPIFLPSIFPSRTLPCFSRGVGLDDPQRSLPTPTIL